MCVLLSVVRLGCLKGGSKKRESTGNHSSENKSYPGASDSLSLSLSLLHPLTAFEEQISTPAESANRITRFGSVT